MWRFPGTVRLANTETAKTINRLSEQTWLSTISTIFTMIVDGGDAAVAFSKSPLAEDMV